MATKTLNENINQAIADFDSIKKAIEEKTKTTVTGPTSGYAEKIKNIGGGGSSSGEVAVEIKDLLDPENYLLIGSNMGNVHYQTISGYTGKVLSTSYINWGAVLLKDIDIKKDDELIITHTTRTDGGGITAYSYVGFFTEDEFESVTKDDERWIELTSTKVTSSSNTLIKEGITANQNGKLCFLLVHGDEQNSFTAFFQPISAIVVSAGSGSSGGSVEFETGDDWFLRCQDKTITGNQYANTWLKFDYTTLIDVGFEIDFQPEDAGNNSAIYATQGGGDYPQLTIYSSRWYYAPTTSNGESYFTTSVEVDGETKQLSLLERHIVNFNKIIDGIRYLTMTYDNSDDVYKVELGSGRFQSPYIGYSEDASGIVLMNYNDRAVYKKSDKPCYFGWSNDPVNSNHWWWPIVISEYEEGTYYSMYDSPIRGYGKDNSENRYGSFEYNGKTYYYCYFSGGSYSNATSSQGVHVVVNEDTPEELTRVSKEIIDKSQERNSGAYNYFIGARGSSCSGYRMFGRVYSVKFYNNITNEIYSYFKPGYVKFTTAEGAEVKIPAFYDEIGGKIMQVDNNYITVEEGE